MEGQLPEALGQLYAQLKKTLEDKQINESDTAHTVRLTKEFEDVAAMISRATPGGIGPTESISAYSLGPAPTSCKACGRPFRKNL